MRSPEETEALLDKLESLLGDVDSANDRYNRDNWRANHSEFFEPYQDKLHRLNGDDFDISDATYDEYNNTAKGMGLSEGDYLNGWKTRAEEIFARIWPEAPEEVKEEAAEEIAEEVNEVTTEEPPEGTPEPIEEESTVVATTDPEVAEGVVESVADEIPEEEEVTSDESAKESDKFKGAENLAKPVEDDWKLVKKRGSGANGPENDWPNNPKDVRSDEKSKEATPPEAKAEEDEFSTWKKGVEEDAARLRRLDRNRR